jgi:hypothetical protein
MDNNISTNYKPAEAVQTKYNTVTYMSMQEKHELSFHLQKYHAIFRKFFGLGAPIFDYCLPTAAVYAERVTGRYLYMKINPDFWASLTLTQKLFVVSHESLHLILNHLTRMQEVEFLYLGNVAKDLVINHMAVEKFNFKRSEIDPDNVYCWVDKFFTPEDEVKTNETAEYYYDLLVKKKEEGKLPEGYKLVDEHNTIEIDDIDEFMKQMDRYLTPEEKESLKDILLQHGSSATAGQGGQGSWTFFNFVQKKKKKWETVIKNWALKSAGFKTKINDQWAKTNRRHLFLGKNLFLPSTLEHDAPKHDKKKIDVFFFLDTSGSCHHLAERFFKSAKSLPEEYFNIRLFCFHDYVVETDISGNKIHKGGGTRFDIIENEIAKNVAQGQVPHAIFLVSDGDGSAYEPANPEKWHWFLSTNHDHLIDKRSHIYKLEDYE